MNQETRNYEAEVLKKCIEDNERRILDSGKRRQFESGAVRDIQEGKGRCDLLPLIKVGDLLANLENLRSIGSEVIEPSVCAEILDNIHKYMETVDSEYIHRAIIQFGERVWPDIYTVILEVSKHYEEGAQKYEERNWEKGIPAHCYVDSGIRHLLKYCRGDIDEPHDRAFVWNMLCLVWTVDNKPEMNDLPRYGDERKGE